ncbi:MAG: class I SAM-dependent RNA methyltransferase [Desulfovibrio sp.]|jgi:23S rRNA (uracil1939-C5)-methyltransferase|nr:class I SAM-dependent RNA methyltransferase [Desulfovibrio sp.]
MRRENAFSPAPVVGDMLENLLISDLSVKGEGIARSSGRVVFLDKGLPGEIVRARITGVKKNLLHARIESVLKPSPNAVPALCPHVRDCGGCVLQHYSYQALLEWKRDYVRQCLSRIGKLELGDISPVEPSARKLAWRAKVSYAFTPVENRGILLGLRGRDGRELIETTHCVAQEVPVMQLLDYVRREVNRLGIPAWGKPACNAAGKSALSGGGDPGYLRRLVAHSPEYMPDGRRQLLIEIISGSDHLARDKAGQAGAPNAAGDSAYRRLTRLERLRMLGERLMDRFALTGFVHTERRALSDIAYGEKKVQGFGSDAYLESFGHVTAKASYNVFMQTNTKVALRLFELVAEQAKARSTDIVWDLFSGVGCIAMFLARSVATVHGVEVSPEAVACARENAGAMGLSNCFFHVCDLNFPGAMRDLPAPDIVVADPPRFGLPDALIELLLAVPARRLLYVSCNPASQARDALRLKGRWRALKSLPLDMFPYSPHVENLLVFEKR